MPSKGAFTLEEFLAWAAIARSKFYQEVNAGRIRMRKIGRKSVITFPDALEWLTSLPEFGEVKSPSNSRRRGHGQ
jgi:hypothetical protein